jgi:hypothetical protein
MLGLPPDAPHPRPLAFIPAVAYTFTVTKYVIEQKKVAGLTPSGCSSRTPHSA